MSDLDKIFRACGWLGIRPLKVAVDAGNGRAGIGPAFDGDAGGCFVADERGEIVSPSMLTAPALVRG